MYSTHDEGTSVVAEKLIKPLEGKIYKKMTANDNKYDLGYLNMLVHEYNNTCHHSIGKKSY